MLMGADTTAQQDSSYEKIMQWNDTTDDGGGYNDSKRTEINRYRYGPRLPDDNLEPTYYRSPWMKMRDA